MFFLNRDYAHLDLIWFGYIVVTIVYAYIYMYMYIHIYIYAVTSHHHPLFGSILTLKRSVWEREKRWWNWRIAIWSSLELVLHSIPPSYTLLGGRCLDGGNPHDTTVKEKVKICGMNYGYDWYMINMPWLVSVDMISIHFAEFLPSDQWTFWQ